MYVHVCMCVSACVCVCEGVCMCVFISDRKDTDKWWTSCEGSHFTLNGNGTPLKMDWRKGEEWLYLEFKNDVTKTNMINCKCLLNLGCILIWSLFYYFFIFCTLEFWQIYHTAAPSKIYNPETDKERCASMFIAALVRIALKRKHPRCPPLRKNRKCG